MHAIINILFDCKLRNIYGLKWTTTSKRSSPPRGREWKICLNMKVVKWVAAHTGMFIKRSVKTGKTLAIDRFTHSTRFYCQCVCAGCSYVSGELSCVIVFVFMGALQTVHPQTNQRDICCTAMCKSSRAYLFTWAGVYMLGCLEMPLCRMPCLHVCSVCRSSRVDLCRSSHCIMFSCA